MRHKSNTTPPPDGMWPRYVSADQRVWRWGERGYQSPAGWLTPLWYVRRGVEVGDLVVPYDDVPWDKVHAGEVRPPERVALPERDHRGMGFASARHWDAVNICDQGKLVGCFSGTPGVYEWEAAEYIIDHKTNTATLEWWRGQDDVQDPMERRDAGQPCGAGWRPGVGEEGAGGATGRAGGSHSQPQPRDAKRGNDDAKVVTCPYCDETDHKKAEAELLSDGTWAQQYELYDRGRMPPCIALAEYVWKDEVMRRLNGESGTAVHNHKLAILRGEVPDPVFADEADARAVWSWEKAVR